MKLASLAIAAVLLSSTPAHAGGFGSLMKSVLGTAAETVAPGTGSGVVQMMNEADGTNRRTRERLIEARRSAEIEQRDQEIERLKQQLANQQRQQRQQRRSSSSAVRTARGGNFMARPDIVHTQCQNAQSSAAYNSCMAIQTRNAQALGNTAPGAMINELMGGIEEALGPAMSGMIFSGSNGVNTNGAQGVSTGFSTRGLPRGNYGLR